MSTIDNVLKYVKEECEKYKETSEDHYDFWDEHIQYVYNESIWLATFYKADLEIVALGALLHDIALVLKVGTKADHHINGEKIARKVLEENNYDSDKMERVLKCVLNHRSSKNATNLEEMCVADADILAHLKNMPMLFSRVCSNSKSPKDIREEMKKILTKEYDDLSDKTKELSKKYFDDLCLVILGEMITKQEKRGGLK